MALSSEERGRYARHLSLPEIGEPGQERLRAGRVLVVGAGGLGSSAALHVAAAGVGTVGIMDADRVELSNLQRQLLHSTADVGRPKVESAVAALLALNPHVRAVGYAERLTADNASRILGDYEFIVDATDNFDSKFLIADGCHAAGKPYSHAGIQAFLGQTFTVLPGRTACYRCIFDAPPDEPCGQPPQGPLGVVPGVIGTIQAAEAIKYLLGIGGLLTDRLLVYDALRSAFRSVLLKRNPGCRLCGEGAR